MKAKLLLVLALTMTMPLLFMAPKVHTSIVPIPGDINGDGHVNILDVVLAATQYMLTPDSPGYNATIVSRADLAPPFNGIINMEDLVTIISHYTG